MGISSKFITKTTSVDNKTIDINGDGQLETKYGYIIPIGSIIPWYKDLDNSIPLPDGFLECNGQQINDEESVYNGKSTPDLNNNNYFLRGSSTSGNFGGSAVFNGTFTSGNHIQGSSTSGYGLSHESGEYQKYHTHKTDISVDTIPPYMDIVFIIKIK